MFMNERAGLPQGTELIMEDGKKLVLKEIVGKGASCIVYNAERIDHSGKAHNARVKECFPAYSAITRQGNCLIADPSVEEKFREAKARFREAYNKNVDFRNRSGLTNFTSDPYECYEQNGTVYSVFSFDEGDNYRVHEDGNLQEVFEHAKAIADVIKRYHEAGCLHLDIKPENVLITKPDKRVILFDFDSLVELDVLEKLRNGNGENNATPVLSYSEGFSAPEQMMGDLETIGVVSDVYSVGALVWFKIFGRTPERMGYSFGTKFNFSDIKYPDERYRPGLWKELSRLFQNCLATYPPDRWNDMGEVSKCLEKLIALADVERTYLHCEYRYNSGEMHFVGRRKELKMLEDAMAVPDRNMVFVSGIGGIGKTELVRYYAHLNEENYDNIAFLHYEHSLEETFCSDNLRINAFEREEGESIEAYFERKLKVLKAVATKKDLIIIDNFDTCEEDEINKCLSLAKGCECKFLITTREDFTQGGRSLVFQIPIDRMEDDAELMELFVSYQPMEYSEDETEAIRELFELVDRHTMTVGMLANYIEYKEVLPSTLLCKLKEKSGIVNVKGSVSQEKDQEIRTRSVINHLLDLFDLSEFSPVEEEVIKSLALLGYIRITRKRFFELLSENGKDTDEEVEEAVENLRRRGWLQVDKETRKLYLHAVIRDLVIGELKPTSTECPRIVNSMIAYMEKELPNETEQNIRERLMKSFMEGIVGNDLSYVRLCILYRKIEYCEKGMNVLRKLEEQSEGNRELWELIYKLRHVRIVLLGEGIYDVKFEDDEVFAFEMIVKDAIEEAKELEKVAKEWLKKYPMEMSGIIELGRLYVELGAELQDVLECAVIMWESDRMESELVKTTLDKGYQYIETCYDKGESYIIDSNMSNVEKKSLLMIVQEFYMPDDIFFSYRSEKYSNIQKARHYQNLLDELKDDDLCSKNDGYVTTGGVKAALGYTSGFEREYSEAVREIARKHIERGDFACAEECLISRVEYRNGNVFDFFTHNLLIEVFCAEGKYEEAKKYAGEMIRSCETDEVEFLNDSIRKEWMIIGFYHLYALERDNKKKERLWSRCIQYYKELEKGVAIREALIPFFVEYLLRMEDKSDLIGILSFWFKQFWFGEEEKERLIECLLREMPLNEEYSEFYVRLLIMQCEDEITRSRSHDYEKIWTNLMYVKELCERFNLRGTDCEKVFYRALGNYYIENHEFDKAKEVYEQCNLFEMAEKEGKDKELMEQCELWRRASWKYHLIDDYIMEEKCLREGLKILFPALDRKDIVHEYLLYVDGLFKCYSRQKNFMMLKQEAQSQWNIIVRLLKELIGEEDNPFICEIAWKHLWYGLLNEKTEEDAIHYFLLSALCELAEEEDCMGVYGHLRSWTGEAPHLFDIFGKIMRGKDISPKAVDKIINIYDSIKDLLSEDPRYADLQKEFTRFLDKHQRAAVEFRRE